MKFRLILFVFVLICILSCKQDDTCRENKVVALHIDFVNQINNTKLLVDSISVNGLGKDSMIYNNKKNADKILVELNSMTNNCTFVIKFNNTTDTLNVKYINKEYFISYSCGIVTAHELDTLISTNHYIRKIVIKNRFINTTDEQHVQIFH